MATPFFCDDEVAERHKGFQGSRYALYVFAVKMVGSRFVELDAKRIDA